MKQHKSNIVGRIAGTMLLLVLFAMFSCTNDQEKYGEILEAVNFETVQTRATDSSFENGDKIGIYVVESGKNFLSTGNYADNKQYNYQDGKLQPVTNNDKIYSVKGKSYTYHAYYPYHSGINPSAVVYDATSTTTKNRPLWSMNNRNSGSSVQLAFNNVFGLIEVNINETSDKIVSGAILRKYPKVTMNMCSNTLSTIQQDPASVPLTLYNSSSSVSTFRTFLPAGNVITSGDDLFSFKTTSSESKKYYATKDITTVAGEKNVFSLTLLEEYLIKATSTTGGSITNNATAWANGQKFKDGQQCSIPFAANSGYFFDGIYENNVKQNCSSSPYTFNVTKARTLEVRFKANVITYGNWNVSVSASPTTIAAGGGTSLITTTATRDILTNGVKTGTETGNPTLSVSGSGFSLSGKTLTASNNTGSARSCTITATHGGVSKTCTVTQSAVSITYGSWVVSVSASPTTIAAAGGTSSITTTATRDILTNGVKTGTETGNPTLSVSGSGFSLSGKTLTASNNIGSARSCTVTATHSGVSKTCTVTQSAVSITYGSWVVSVSASPTTIAASGGTSTISASAVRDVFTNGVKTGTDTGTPTLSASGTGFSLSGKILTAGNNTGSSRSCTVTATHGGVSKTCTVTQSAGVITYEYSFSVSPTFLSFSSKGETKSFTVSSTRIKFINGTSTGTTENVGYTSAVSGAGASGFSVSGTSVIASENPTTDFRDATVTFTQTGSGKTATITLEQERKISIDTEI
ncbi:fimbrillin family protein [Bacteroides thetaiotaomicron]|uniref:fimbrillin family protein n=1 Tax=Bacteroides thetaiotaomicron TaxID=818 RepID=UPI00101BA62D|nr:fimbrillin family protein [Bacteroides thetaiotaomicron]